ncbi:MAG: site-specific tyrosine recombinase/integron integrase [Candidatus Woesearchaeota archaeon]
MITFLKELENELKIRGFSNATIKTYKYQVEKFVEWLKENKGRITVQRSLLSDNKGSINFSNVSKSDIKAFIGHLISDKGKSPSSVNLALSSLRFFFIEVLKQNIFDGIKAPKSEKKIPTVLTKEEVKSLIEAVGNPRHKILIMLMYGSGLRVSETVSLRINDLDLDDKTGVIRAGKGNKDRNIIISDALILDIKKYFGKRKDGNPYIFNRKEGHITSRQAQRIVSGYANKAGLKKRVFCHALRSSFATHLLESGTDIRVIQELLGHSNLATTERYTKVSKEQIKKVRSPFDEL